MERAERREGFMNHREPRTPSISGAGESRTRSWNVRRGRQIAQEVLCLGRSRPTTVATMDAAAWLRAFSTEAAGSAAPRVQVEVTTEDAGPLWVSADGASSAN